jgi:hypothetical protein
MVLNYQHCCFFSTRRCRTGPAARTRAITERSVTEGLSRGERWVVEIPRQGESIVVVMEALPDPTKGGKPTVEGALA